MSNYYAVHKGRIPGIYKDWINCQKQINGYNGAIYKKFKNDYGAAYYFYENGKYINNCENKQRIGKNIKKINEYFKLEDINNTKNNISDISNNIIAYTDGSCINNGTKKAKAGIGIYFGENNIHNISEKFENIPTNQRAEIYAITKCIYLLKEKMKVSSLNKIIIYTDSQYTINCVTKWIPKWIKNNWINSKNQEVKNQDLLKELYNLYNTMNIELKHIYSHTNNKDVHSLGNEEADKLAIIGANL